MDPIEETAVFPAVNVGPHQPFLTVLVTMLTRILSRIAWRLNRVLPVDGSEAMTGPLELKSYLTAGLPPAAANTGAIVYVSDAAPANHFQGSDGAAWVVLG